MVQTEFILFSISLLPVVLIAFFLYKNAKKKYSFKLLTLLFIGGIVSVIPAVILELLVGTFFPPLEEMNLSILFAYSFIGIALIEELCKWSVVYFFAYRREAFSSIYAMILFAVFSALGFAFLENLTYVYEHGVVTGVIRALLSVPSHAIDGALMGYYLGLAQISSKNGKTSLVKKYMFLSLAVPILFHAIYNYLLLSEIWWFLIFFAILIIGIYIYTFLKIKKAAFLSELTYEKENVCRNCHYKGEGMYCAMCGIKKE